MESKAISIGYISRVSAGNVNASHTEGNVMVTKKVTLPDGTTLPYISGQAIRRMIRDRLYDLGEELAETQYTVKGQEVTPLAKPWEYIDEDLFGYLDPSGSKKRTSPVRVSAAVGLFPFRGDRDLGTRSFEKFGKTIGAGGNMFETEIYNNLFKGAILIELDRIGKFPKLETGEKEDKEINDDEKRNRVKKLLDALSILWGGGRTARMLVDMSPKFFGYVRLKVKYPVFLENIEVRYEDGSLILLTEPIKAVLDKIKNYKEVAIFGYETGLFGNENEIISELEKYGKVYKMSRAIAEAKEDVEGLWKK